MRALSATLLAAQRASSGTPYVRVEFILTGEDDVIFTTQDGDPAGSANRILSIDDWEEPYGGACVIRIRNHDQYFKAINWKGEPVEIGWGFVTGEGNEYSENRRLWVVNQRDVSMEGELVTEFQCVDNWARIASTLLISAGVKLAGTLVNSEAFVIGETITGSVSGATGKLSWIGDAFIVVTNVTGTFQTADGGADDADGASASCDALTAVTSQSAAGGGEWNKNTTILNILKAILSGLVSDVTLDADDPDDTINTHQPYLMLPIGTRVRGVVRQLLQMSKCGARMENDLELHVLYLNAAADADYAYDSDHAFKVDIREEAAILPNQVLFVDQLPQVTGLNPSYFGTAESGERDIGNFLSIQVDETITSDAEAVKRAEAWIAHREAEAHQGTVLAPMSCNQELYDMVEITDTRADVTVKGRVGRIDRHFSSGRYDITIRLGGILTTPGATRPGPDQVDWDIKDISITTPKDRVTLRKVVYPWQLWKAVQPYVCDIAFSSVDKDTIAWAEGTITFADGSALTINANGGQDLASAGWLYFTEGSGTLTFTASFADCVAPTHGLVAFVAPGTETGQTALVWPAAGKVPLLNADILTVMTLSALTANVGTLTAGIIEGVVVYGGDARQVTLDSTGLKIKAAFRFYYGDDYVGYMFPSSATQLTIASWDVPNDTKGYLYLLAASMGLQAADGITIAADLSMLAPAVGDVRIEADQDIFLDAEGDDIDIYAYDDIYLEGGGFVNIISGGLQDIELDPAGGDVRPGDTSQDLGTSTLYWDDINYSDLIDRTPSALSVLDALTKIKAMKTYAAKEMKKGEYTGRTLTKFDRGTYPMELLVPAKQDDYDAKDRVMRALVEHKDKFVARREKLLGMKDKPFHRTDVSQVINGKIVTKPVIVPVKEVNERIDKLVSNLDRRIARINNRMATTSNLQPQTGVSMNATVGLLLSAIKELTDRVEQLEGGGQ